LTSKIVSKNLFLRHGRCTVLFTTGNGIACLSPEPEIWCKKCTFTPTLHYTYTSYTHWIIKQLLLIRISDGRYHILTITALKADWLSGLYICTFKIKKT